MYKKILVPVDLADTDLAKPVHREDQYGSSTCSP
jgi:hypothetical protein